MEKNVEAKLGKMVKREGGLCWKFLSTVRGVPDRIILMPGGKVFFVELKYGKRKTSKMQDYIIDLMRSMGHTVFIVRDDKGIEEVKDAIRSARVSE